MKRPEVNSDKAWLGSFITMNIQTEDYVYLYSV